MIRKGDKVRFRHDLLWGWHEGTVQDVRTTKKGTRYTVRAKIGHMRCRYVVLPKDIKKKV